MPSQNKSITAAHPQIPIDVHYLLVDAEQALQRLDNFLLAALRGVPRSLVYRLVRTGQVRVNHKRAQVGLRLHCGDQIRIPPVHLPTSPIAASPPNWQVLQLERAILHEDDKLLIINKPAGMAVHGGSGMSYGVIEALRTIRTPHLELVHRLDRDTSGCLMLAKRRNMLKWLHEIIRTNALEKRYLALLTGCMPRSVVEVDAPLRKNTLQSGERIVRVDAEGKSAKTRFQCLQRFNIATLVEVQPQSGRTHQIRVHAAHMGLPIAGDAKYGHRATNVSLKTMGLQRLFLHATTLGLNLPDGKRLEVTAPLDPALASLLPKLMPINQ